MTAERCSVTFVTTNKGKLSSVARVFGQHGIDVVQYERIIPELQEGEVAAIAASKVVRAALDLGKPGLVMAIDSALHIPSLNGFPGPFVKQVTQWIGPEGYLRLLNGKDGRDRKACFEDAIACMSLTGGPRIFLRRVWGTIADHVWDGTGGTGKSAMDKLFVPDGHEKALVAMDDEELQTFRSSTGVEKAYHAAAQWFLGAA